MTPLSKTIRFPQPLVGATLADPGRESEGLVCSVDERLEMAPYELEAIKARAFAEGVNAGREEAETAYNNGLSQQAELCAQAAKALDSLRIDLHKEMQAAVADLVVEATGRLLAAWKPDAKAVEALVEQLLEDFDPADHHMRIRLNTESLQLLDAASISRFKENYTHLEFSGDSRLEPGECLLEGRFGLTDARYSEKLKNLSEVLTDE